MPIRWDKRNKRWRFEFDRRIAGVRHRISRLLPKGWSQSKADEYDRAEASRLFEIATGLRKPEPLIDEAIEHYLRDKTGLKSFKATAENLGAIAWAYAGKPTSQLAAIAAEVCTAESARGMSPATIRNRLACLKAACRWAWKAHGLTETDPTVRMILPAVRNERHVYLQRLGMLRVARAAVRHDVRVAIRVAFYTGMRLGELRAVQVRGNVLELVDTKNGDRRAIPAHRRIRTCLRYLPLTAPKITLQRGWQRAREASGIGDVRFHDLRHSAASELVNAGVDLFTVGEVLGHRDPRSTKRYSHLRHERLVDAIGLIGRKEVGKKLPHKPAKKKAARKAA